MLYHVNHTLHLQFYSQPLPFFRNHSPSLTPTYLYLQPLSFILSIQSQPILFCQERTNSCSRCSQQPHILSAFTMDVTSTQLPTATAFVSLPEDFIWLPKSPFPMHMAGQTPRNSPQPMTGGSRWGASTPAPLPPGKNLRCRLSAVSQSCPVRLDPIPHSGCLLAGAPFMDSLIFSVSLLLSPTGVCWDHPPPKLLAFSLVSSAQPNISSGHTFLDQRVKYTHLSSLCSAIWRLPRCLFKTVSPKCVEGPSVLFALCTTFNMSPLNSRNSFLPWLHDITVRLLFLPCLHSASRSSSVPRHSAALATLRFLQAPPPLVFSCHSEVHALHG